MSYWDNKRVLVTGGAGFLGSHIVNELCNRGCEDIVVVRSSEYDLRAERNVMAMYYTLKPDIVIHAAAYCGGIGLNKAKPAELFYDNIMMGLLLMEEGRKCNIEKFVQIGTVCEYPKFAKVPFRESEIWEGYPEETNAPYGLAKKVLMTMGQAYRQQYGMNTIHLLPTNLYGPGDNFDPNTSHVIPALIRRCSEAKRDGLKELTIWGTGTATRDFLYAEDAAKGIVLATEMYNEPDPVNLGSGREVLILELATKISALIGFEGKLVWDESKPDGQPRRILTTNIARERFGFKAETKLEAGLDKTIKWWYSKNA